MGVPRGAVGGRVLEILSIVGPFFEIKVTNEPQMYGLMGRLEMHVVSKRPRHVILSKRKCEDPKKGQNGRFWAVLA